MVFIYYLYYYGDNIATKYYISDPAGLCCVTTELINNIDVGGCLIAAWSRADRGPGPPDGPRGQDQAACVGSVSEVESGSGSLGKEVTPSSTYIRIVNAVGCFRRQPYIKIKAFDIYSFFFRIAASQTPISRYETDGPPGRPQILHRIIGFVS